MDVSSRTFGPQDVFASCLVVIGLLGAPAAFAQAVLGEDIQQWGQILTVGASASPAQNATDLTNALADATTNASIKPSHLAVARTVRLARHESLERFFGHRQPARAEAIADEPKPAGQRQLFLFPKVLIVADHLVDLWAYHHQVRLEFSRPGKPTDNAHIESFNGSFRDECLNTHWFSTLADAKTKIEAWRRHYKETRPNKALGHLTPLEYKVQTSLERQKIT